MKIVYVRSSQSFDILIKKSVQFSSRFANTNTYQQYISKRTIIERLTTGFLVFLVEAE